MRQPLIALAVVAACAWLAASCQDKEILRAMCSSDEVCVEQHDGNQWWVCDATVGDCVCIDDAACLDREHCEKRPGGDGRCHPNRTCEWNTDCPTGQFCDTETRFCRMEGCVVDRQCPLGEVCNQATGQCIQGCRSFGDCAVPGDACLCLGPDKNPIPCVCDATTEEGRLGCQLGACTSDTCEDKTFCKWGEKCEAPQAGETLARCVKDTSGPFCEGCQIQPGSTNYRCGQSGANYCLVDTTTLTGSFCGVDCYKAGPGGTDGMCPNGFSCRDVRVVMGRDQCWSDDDCMPRAGAPTCEEDKDCPGSDRCVGGRCAPTCLGAEGGVRGYCGCVTDDDCAKQDCVGGECEITGRLCATNEECRDGFGAIRCEHVGGGGRCWIGKNCAPDEGISCSDVRSGKGPLD